MYYDVNRKLLEVPRKFAGYPAQATADVAGVRREAPDRTRPHPDSVSRVPGGLFTSGSRGRTHEAGPGSPQESPSTACLGSTSRPGYHGDLPALLVIK